jgi:aconitate hydratase
LAVGDNTYEYYPLDSVAGVARLPYSLKILAENLLRNYDGVNITDGQIAALANWDPKAEPKEEIQFTPARVVMQDFTGVPCVVDLAAMREAMAALGGDPAKINPLVPAELVIDHSVQIDVAGRPDAFKRNVEFEYQRNGERYQFLRWGQDGFKNFVVVPPGTGIVHQVNIEYLARVVMAAANGKVVYPDSCVGTDSHTTMVNGLGVLGWGVGGIEAEAAMLGQPVSMLIPKVVGFRLTGEIPSGVTATDVVLTITEMLRKHGVVGKFVEFYGDGVAQVPLANRATIGNMSPEFGSTAAIFPIDEETLNYLRFTGRAESQVQLVEKYAKAQGLWHDPKAAGYQEPEFSEYLELDLSSVVPSIAGPTRPQDRINLSEAKQAFEQAVPKFMNSVEAQAFSSRFDPIDAVPREASVDEGDEESFPASDPLAVDTDVSARPAGSDGGAAGRMVGAPDSVAARGSVRPGGVISLDTSGKTLDHGHVVIASITSCTNTSNPSVMMAAGLLARNAVAKGLHTKPWVKTSLAPGSKVVTDYLERADLWPALNELGFNLVGYGCTTCIGNSGPLAPEISAAVAEHDLAVAAVLSGNRNFEGRINPDVKMNYLASPPLVIAYAIAGTMDFDFESQPLGTDQSGKAVYLRDIWPTNAEIERNIASALDREMFLKDYADVFTGDEHWKNLPVPTGEIFQWEPDSTYVRHPPYFENLAASPAPVSDISNARVLVKVGDSVTTDHISPAGSIKADSPAGKYLQENGVRPAEFNSYGARRGNHEVMIRGTFGNIRLRNLLLAGENDGAGVQGGFTRCFCGGLGDSANVLPIYDAAQCYAKNDIPLVVLAGQEYGTGSSRDWAAKGTALLGVKAVIAESFERIHRSNLIGMGVLPLQFPQGATATSLGLDGTEEYSITGITELNNGVTPKTVRVVAKKADGAAIEFDALVRIDTPGEAAYYRNGGILPYVLRSLAAA